MGPPLKETAGLRPPSEIFRDRRLAEILQLANAVDNKERCSDDQDCGHPQAVIVREPV